MIFTVNKEKLEAYIMIMSGSHSKNFLFLKILQVSIILREYMYIYLFRIYTHFDISLQAYVGPVCLPSLLKQFI
jgi:uncharacterized membrane protein YesL